MANVLVTGGAGFIGSHLAEALLADGHEVTVVDNLVDGGRGENVPNGAKFIRCDLASPMAAEIACHRADVVYHLAAVCSVQKSITNPRRTQDCGEVAFLNVLKAAHAYRATRVVLASSASVYGEARVPVYGEIAMMAIREDHPLSPISPYAASKMACEGYAKAYCELGLDTVALRFFNVFGPRQDSSSPYSGVIAKFADKMRRGERPVVYGDGLQTRDFCHVSNVVRACILAGGHQGKLRGIAINVGCSVPSTVLNVVDGLNAALGTKLDPVHEPAKPGDPRHSLADISLARSALGYEPLVGLEEGLALTVNTKRTEGLN